MLRITYTIKPLGIHRTFEADEGISLGDLCSSLRFHAAGHGAVLEEDVKVLSMGSVEPISHTDDWKSIPQPLAPRKQS